MKYNKMLLILLFNSLLVFALKFDYIDLPSITFGDTAESSLKNKGIFKVEATYKLDDPQKYLYIYSQYYEKEMYLNKANFKIYFKQISNEDKDVNYLDSDYSTLDFNSGLLIKINTLKYNKANIFIIAYETAYMKILYNYVNDVQFPNKFYYMNMQLNQFKLEKGGTKTINYKVQCMQNEYLIILCKTSLRNIEVTVNYNGKDYSKEVIAGLYPNGYSLFIDTKDKIIYNTNDKDYDITIKNKNNVRDEIIILGYMHHEKGEIFTNKLVNGYQMYLESNNNDLYSLPNQEKSNIDQYFLYQIYSKKGKMTFDSSINTVHHFTEYNSMIHYNIDTSGTISFDFRQVPKRNALYIQYIDYSEIDVAQKSLQALVSGSPKSMLIPAKNSMYHFLPIERESTNINYYLRSKTPNDQNMFISFKTCNNYPEECIFKTKDEKSVNPINNVGLWFSEKTNKNELQIIYVYCEKECAYDILMTYDNDPLFMFPENNYTKFISEEGQDIFILPVFEYLSNNQSINIDLSVISGNAELTLYKNLDKMEQITLSNNQKEIIGNRQLYTISNDSYSNSDYYKKDIYAVVKGDKNTFYNLMYGAGATNDKILDNNRVIVESVYVDAEKKKNFIFRNQGDNLYISISSLKCKSKINIDGKEVPDGKNTHMEKINSKGYHVVQIYLIEDELFCKKGQKEEVTLFAYNSDNTNILLSENTLVNTIVEKEITFRHIFKPDLEQNADNSFSVELERLSDSKSLKFGYKLEKISFNSSESKQSSNKEFSTYVFGKKANLISNKLIKDVCGSLDQNEVCSLSLTLSSSSSSTYSFNLYLNKNGRNTARHVVDETLINIINQKSIRYYYIDANKDYDTEILINSFGQDLFYKYVVESTDKKENDIIPFEKSGFKSSSNYHKIEVAASECGSTCRIYLGVYAKENSLAQEVPTTFEISYLLKQKNVRKKDVQLPLNYWVQYTFDTLSEIVYSLESYDAGALLLELYAIKENVNDNCEVEASFNNVKLTSSEGNKKASLTKSTSSITIKPKTGEKCRFKFRASSLGKSDDVIVPILPYSSEKCVITDNKKPCYYALDISPENDIDSAYFYVPETEDAYITIYKVNHGLPESEENIQNLLKGEKSTSQEYYKRQNWHEQKINKGNMTLIVGVTTQTVSKINLTLYSSFSNKPEEVTLNQGQKKIFTIERSSKINTMSLKIKKGNSQTNKYKINIHAVKGNGFFTLFDESYPLGLDYNNKEEITIVIDKSDNDIEIVATNQYNENSLNDFTFSIDYTITTLDQLFNKLEPSKINSYKIIKPGASDLPLISFYMKANYTGNTYNDVNMNVKIFSYSTYEIKACIVDEDFINEKSSNINAKLEKSSDGEVTSYIEGKEAESDFTLAKIEISGSKLSEFKKDVPKKELYIYVTFSKKDKKNKVRIDIYPYDISNSLPLAQNELFIHKLPAGTPNYQLLLVKSDNKFNDMYIEYLAPSSNKYNYAIANLDGKNAQEKAITQNETNILDASNYLVFGKNKLKIKENNEGNQLKYLLFNVFSDDNNKESKNDQFVFKYESSIYTEIVSISDQGFSVDNSAGVKFKFDAQLPMFSSGKSVFIIKAYKKSEVEGLNIDENYLSLYLLFSDIKPVYTLYKSLTKEEIKKKIEQEYTIEWNKDGGEYIFTCVNIVLDNERTEYLGYKAETKEIKSSSSKFLDYMRNHIFATIIIFIIILFVCGMICNIIRIDRRPKRGTIGKIEVDKIMDDV